MKSKIEGEGVAMCHLCMTAKGYTRSNVSTTAFIKPCAGCGQQRAIVPARHWKKASNKNG